MSAGGKLLVVGFVLVLVAGVALLRFVGSDSNGASASASDPVTPSETAPATVATASSPSASVPVRSGSIVVETPRPDTGGASAAPPPSEAPSLAAPSDDGIMIGSNGRPIPLASLPVLRAKAAVTDAMIADCIAKHGGKTVTGKAILTFQVGKTRVKGVDKIEVEATGIEEDGTTIANQDLLECMHKTHNAMTFDPHPSSIGVWAKRRVHIEGGAITDNWIYDYGHVR